MNNPRLATGRTAEIFAWASGQILKPYHAGTSPDAAAREASRVQAVVAAGIDTPRVIDLVTVDQRQGIVFDRIGGPTMLATLFAQPERLVELAHQMAELHTTIHARTALNLPSLNTRLADRIQRVDLPTDQKAALLTSLSQLPQGNSVCHGDFHPDNIILTEHGPVIIDWVDASLGYPLADVARTYILLRFGTLPSGIDAALRQQIEQTRSQLLTTYLTEYQRRRPFQAEELATWVRPVAAARLAEGLENHDEVQALLALARGELETTWL